MINLVNMDPSNKLLKTPLSLGLKSWPSEQDKPYLPISQIAFKMCTSILLPLIRCLRLRSDCKMKQNMFLICTHAYALPYYLKWYRRDGESADKCCNMNTSNYCNMYSVLIFQLHVWYAVYMYNIPE